METGLFVTFFEPAEAFDKELPPVGPLDHVVLRPRQLLAERPAVPQTHDPSVAIERWLEAELELQRALGVEPGGPKRSQVRVSARDGVFIRFVVYGDARERDLVPELGPFAVVVADRRAIEADGQLLATRGASDLAPWELTSNAGPDLAGLHKPDVAFRVPGGGYHPSIVAAPPRAPGVTRAAPPQIVIAPESASMERPSRQPAPAVTPVTTPHVEPPAATSAPAVAAPAPAMPSAPAAMYAAAVETSTPPAVEATPGPPALTASDLALIERMEREREQDLMRARMLEEERRRLGVDEADEAATTWAMRYRPQPESAEAAGSAFAESAAEMDWRALLWRMRFALIGLLLLAVGAYGFVSFRNGYPISFAGGGPSLQMVGVAQKFSGTRWDYVVNGVQRVPTSGTSRARGIYYVVRVGVTNRGTDGAQISPASFTLIDANGGQYTASSVSSGVYYGSDNTSSQYAWPQTFPVGKTTAITLIFDVDPGLGRGNQLAIDELPRTRVSLD